MRQSPSRLSYEEFKSIYSKVPRLCVDLVVRSPEGVLLIERAIEPMKGYWHFPGGTVLMGETIDQATRRVVAAETNLTVEAGSLLGVMEFAGPENPVFHTVSLVFLVENYSGEPKGGEQGRRMDFFAKIPDKTIPEHSAFLIQKGILT